MNMGSDWGTVGYLAAMAAGVALAPWCIYRGLLRDRARGNPRCYRCGYDLRGAPAGSPVVCPECGYKPGSKEDLYRTRRHWRVAALALPILALVYYGTGVRPRVVGGERWTSASVPTTVAILAVPAWPDETLPLVQKRLDARAGAWDWQRGLAARTIVYLARRDPARHDGLCRCLPTVAPRSHHAMEYLAELLKSPDVKKRELAASCLYSYGKEAAYVEDALVVALSDPERNVSSNVLWTLVNLGPEQFATMSDDRLCEIAARAGWDVPDFYLREMIRRGGESIVRTLEIMADRPKDTRYPYKVNLRIILALRRAQRQAADPVRVDVEGGSTIKEGTCMLPTITARIVNADPDGKTVSYHFGGDNRGPRAEKWRIEVRDASGTVVSRPWGSNNFGGLGGYVDLRPGERSRPDALKMSSYVQPLPAGTYTMVVQYHDETHIAERRDVSDLLVVQSSPIRLIIADDGPPPPPAAGLFDTGK